MPEISIIIPTYNRASFLEKVSIPSVLSQTYKDWELIIVDDGSTDSTKEVIESFMERDSRIRYVYQENQGQSVARNKGIKISKGSLIAFLDSDDFFLPENMEKKRKALLRNKVLMINGSSWIINSESRKIIDSTSYSPTNWLVTREFLEAGSCFDPKQRNVEDFGLLLRAKKELGKTFSSVYIREPLTGYFVHKGQVSSGDDDKEEFISRLRSLEVDLGDGVNNETRQSFHYVYSRLGNFYSISGDLLKGRYYFIKDLKLQVNLFSFIFFCSTFLGEGGYVFLESLARSVQKNIFWKFRYLFYKYIYPTSYKEVKSILVSHENSSNK